ncbi:MAG: MBL fold metallo-hydrolase [Saccharofermentanales bacterium]|jgi:hydroxyacylglutathione hydrolase
MSYRSFSITPTLRYYPERFRSCNVYVWSLGERNVLFDPSLAPEHVADAGPIDLLIATHAHFDHIGQLMTWKARDPAPPYWMHAGDLGMLMDPKANASAFFGRSMTFPTPDRKLADGEHIVLDDLHAMDVMNTPGHTHGSSCFLLHEDDRPMAMITGDTLFDMGWGRTDFVTGDDALMRQSLERLYRVLSDLPPELPVCAGHGAMTTARQSCRFLERMGFA